MSTIALGSVAHFIEVLKSKLIQSDVRESVREAKRGRVNIYRLSHYMKAVDEVRESMSGFLGLSDAGSLIALKNEINVRFVTDLRGNPTHSAVKNVFKQIDAWVQSGKRPSLKG